MNKKMTELFRIRTHAIFESAHSIREYLEDPNNPGTYLDEPIHGHTYEIEAFACSNSINERTGFALDFLVLKEKVEELANYLDHKFINEASPFDKINPSTENIAKWFYEEINKIIPKNSWLEKVRVYEGPNNYAEYEIIP